MTTRLGAGVDGSECQWLVAGEGRDPRIWKTHSGMPGDLLFKNRQTGTVISSAFASKTTDPSCRSDLQNCLI